MIAPSLAADLLSFCTAMRSAFGGAEDRLLGIGSALDKAIALLDQLGRSFQGLVVELQGDDLRRAVQDLTTAAAGLGRLTAGQDGSGGVLGRLLGQAREIGGEVRRLDKTIGSIGVLAMNAKIAASYLTGDQADFSSFTAETMRLSALARTSLDSFGRELAALGKDLEQAVASQSGFEAKRSATFAEVPRRLVAGAEAVDGRKLRAATAATAVEERSKKIGQRVGTVVMALQVGDITRQRLEHVESALALLADLLSGRVRDGGDDRSAWWQALSPDQRDAAAAGLCRMQAAQLVNADRQFCEEVRQIATTLGALAGDAREIGRLGADAFGTAGSRQSSFLGELEAEVVVVNGLVEGYRASSAETDQLTRSVADAVGGLTGHVETVQSLEADIRLMGLNTTLRCSRLGVQGRALTVIAQELRAYADQTAEVATEIMQGLRSLVDTAGLLSDSEAHRTTTAISGVATSMTESMTLLAAAGERFGDALAALGRDSQTVAATLEETAAGLTLSTEVGAALRRIAGGLEAAAGASPGAPGLDEIPGMDAQVLGGLWSSYTMEAERAVHGQFAVRRDGGTGGTPEAAVEDVFF